MTAVSDVIKPYFWNNCYGKYGMHYGLMCMIVLSLFLLCYVIFNLIGLCCRVFLPYVLLSLLIELSL